MSKNYKEIYRKNKDGEWERIGSPIDYFVFSGNPSTDQEIVVTNPNFVDASGETTNLYNVLTNIDERLKKHDGNISYLAEHGGGGGGGGGGTSNYKISVTNLNIVDGYYYSQSSSVTVNFMITGGTSSTVYKYRVSYDGNYISGSSTSYENVKNRTTVSINIDDINRYTTVNPHIFIIEALDPYGIDIESFVLKISEMSLTITANTREILKTDNPVVNVTVLNKVINTDTDIIFKNLTEEMEHEYAYSFLSMTSAPQTASINLANNVIKTSSIQTGKDFSIKIYAQFHSSQGGTPITVKSNEIIMTVSFIGGNTPICIFDGVSTKSDYEERGVKSSFATGERIVFGCNLFYGDGNDKTTPIYYALKLDNPNNEVFRTEHPNGLLIKGRYFDENLHEEGISDFKENDYTFNNGTFSVSYLIQNEAYKDTGWTVTVRCMANGISSDYVAKFDIIEGSSEKFGIQIPNRQPGTEKDTLFMHFGSNAKFPLNPSDKVWNSYTKKYTYIHTEYSGETIPNVYANVYNTNGSVSGFFTGEDAMPHLRLQNEAYGIINLSHYENEINQLKTISSNRGFDLSVTFKSDKHPFNDRVIFFMGNNNTYGELIDGFKISLEKVEWVINNGANRYKLETKIQQGVINTIDFIMDPKNNSSANLKIIVNGVINASKNVTSIDDYLSKYIYLGCDYYSNTLTSFSDVNIYDIKLFTKTVNDFHCVINSKEVKYGNKSWSDIKEDFNNWKTKNLIYTKEGSSEPNSRLYQDGTYITPSYSELKGNNPPIPIMRLEAINGEFTKDVFYKMYDESSITSITYNNFTMQYYDPSTNREISEDNVSISLQGTSTLTYKNKNLEIYFDEKVEEGKEDTVLFQPKSDWLPEKRFTLKADVVDSAHANNTTIGKWINELGSDFLENNPAMDAFSENNNKPSDIYTDESKVKHDEGKHTGLKIRHTLEGFPIMLLMKFGGESTDTFLGIYSFNMGRYSYYNMGFKFLKSFTRRGSDGIDNGCPSIIKEYEINNEDIHYGVDKKIVQSNIMSFEFDSAADDNTDEHQTWSQDDISILQHIGSFRYPENPTEFNWKKLYGTTETDKMLFTTLASYLQKNKYTYLNGEYIKTSEKYNFDNNIDPEYLIKDLSIKNAMSYFVIAIGLGMFDSLGKNLTIRTWDGLKWFCCFYDMDTALDLTNTGTEDAEPDLYIDVFMNAATYVWTAGGGGSSTNYKKIPFDENGNRVPYTEIIDPTKINEMVIYPNLRPDKGKSFGAYNSGLWNTLRSVDFKTYDKRKDKKYYEDLWALLRVGNGKLHSQDNFINVLESVIGNCGEMIYNSDYNEKYISSYTSTQGEVTEGNIEKLHGTRIETIRGWLKDRFIFLDGVFEKTDVSDTSLPFYNKTKLTYQGRGSNPDEFIINVTSPLIYEVNTGQAAGDTKKYYLKAYTENKIYTPSIGATSSKQTTINGGNIITNIKGLVSAKLESLTDSKFPSMYELDINNTKTLSKDPIDFSKVFVSGNTSELRSLNLANTKSTSEYAVSLYVENNYSYSKLYSVDISFSNVNSLSLPPTPLTNLKIEGSKISIFELKSQPNIPEINFNGCDRLNKINIDGCDKLTNLNFDSLPNITEINVSNNNSVKTISCKNNSTLKTISFTSMNSLETIDLTNCDNENLSLKINGCPNLKTIILSGCKFETFNSIGNNFGNVELLNITNCINFKGIKFGNAEIETYKGFKVFDLSSFAKLTSDKLLFGNSYSIESIRVPDNESYFSLETNHFEGFDLLKRVFGKISLDGEGIFKGCKNFNLTYSDDAGNYKTEIKINTSNLSECFSNTNSTYDDVTKFFENGSITGLTYIDGLFSKCKNIVITDDFSSTLFSNCGNIEGISSLFAGCTGMTATLPTGILSKLTKVKDFNSVFPETMFYNNDLFCSGLTIERINNFNLRHDDFIDPIYATKLLINLTKLKEITNSFNNENCIYFDVNNGDVNHICPLLSGNTELIKIENSFNEIKRSGGYIKNPFSNNSKLQEISKSFTLKESTSAYTKTNVFVVFDNEFFASCKGTLVKYGLNNSDSDYQYWSNFNGFDKCFEYPNFPKEIIKDCSKLVICEGLFKNVQAGEIDYTEQTFIIHEIGVNEEITASLPDNDFFSGCTSLRCINYMFSDMKGFLWDLKPFTMKNYNIEYMSYLFSDKNSTRRGMIPYGLFYQGKNTDGTVKTPIKDMSYALSSSASSGLTCYRCNFDFEDQAFIDEHVLVNGEWNIYFGDGVNTKINEYYISKSGLPQLPDELALNYISSETPDPVDFKKFFGKHDTPIGSQNEKLLERRYFCPPDIFRYCLNSENFDTNVDGTFNGCSKYSTTEYRYGIYGTICPYLFNPLSNIKVLRSVFSGCLFLLPYKWDTVGISGETETSGHTYYDGIMYPPDLLAQLTKLYNVTSLFAGNTIWGGTKIVGNEYNSSGITTEYGLFGHNSEITIVKSLFSGCYFIWVYDDKNIPEERSQISLKLFGNNNKIYNVSGMLSGVEGTFYIFDTLFNENALYNIYNCNSFMYHDSMAFGTVPALWQCPSYPNKMDYSYAYTKCNNVSNYTSIPDNMKTDRT